MTDYGFSGVFPGQAAARPELLPGRVLTQEKGVYRVVSPQGEQLAQVSGKFRFEVANPGEYPAVGDFVLLDAAQSGGPALIQQVLPRKSVFIRRAAGPTPTQQVVAANVDVIFLCMALNHDYNLRRLERYLSIAWDSGAAPVVVLTKADLCPDLDARRREVEAVAAGAEVLITSSLEQGGCQAVLPYLAPGRTAAFLGSSGVGKSTLINRLLSEDRLDTGGLRGDDRGRHTTTHRELLTLPGGGLVIDTPGMRELGLWEAGEGLEQTFSDMQDLAAACRFRDCTHGREPGCAIQAALRSGTLDPARWASYQKLQTEARTYEPQAKAEKFKAIAKANRSGKKGR